jgi:hypothetical protein
VSSEDFYRVRPLTDEARARIGGATVQRSRFDSTWSSTHTLLRRETEHLVVMRRENGEDVYTKPVLMIDVEERHLRIDGGLRADARPGSPAVGFSLESKHGPLLFVCAAFSTWQDNVRAIALGLEALRKVERYGIVQSAEQYRGWQALPPGTPMPAARMTIEDAAQFIAEHSDDPSGRVVEVADDPAFALALYRDAAKRLHPDAGGDAAMFQRLGEARQLLVDRFGAQP